MQIKKASVVDILIIKKLAEDIWPICYKNIISEAQINFMLQLIYDEVALKNQIEKGHEFIIACNDETPIGFASYGIKSGAEKNIARLHKIYLMPDIAIKGVGTAMLEYICTQCKQLNATLLELNVNKHNPAINFYTKKGFTILKEEVIDIGNGYVMDDYVMGLALDSMGKAD